MTTERRYTPDRITHLAAGEIFVFGSNRAGRHGAGAAKTALDKFGARMGCGEGLQGRSYAIPTKDDRVRTLPLVSIAAHVRRFLKYAGRNPDLTFIVTKIGCGLAGYNVSEIAPLFRQSPTLDVPPNVILPKEFYDRPQTESR